MLNENRFLGTFRGHNTRTNGLRIVHAAVVDLNCVSVCGKAENVCQSG
jgi:hypothetical protein